MGNLYIRRERQRGGGGGGLLHVWYSVQASPLSTEFQHYLFVEFSFSLISLSLDFQVIDAENAVFHLLPYIAGESHNVRQRILDTVTST